MRLGIGIATWNRCELLRKTLNSLAHQRVDEGVDWGILVCDNNCTDQTKAVVESMMPQMPIDYVFEPQQGKSFALNRLLHHSDVDWLILIDDDVRTGPHWLSAYIEGIRRYDRAACLGGPILPWLERRPGRRAKYLLEQFPGAFGLLRVDGDTPMELPDVTAYGGNMALRLRDVPRDGFDVRRGILGGTRVSGEDVGMIRHMLENGSEGHLLAGALVEHYVPPDRIGLGWFCRWQMGFGRNLVVQRGHPAAGKFGVPWWAWRELAIRTAIAAVKWRPWPTRRYYEAVGDAARYYGYLRTK